MFSLPNTIRQLPRFLLSTLPLTTASPPRLPFRPNNDVCGVSVHTADYPELPGFASLEVLWTVPQLFTRPGESGPALPLVAQEVALCCGEYCDSRLSAGILSEMGESGTTTSDLVLQFSPYQDPIRIPLPLGVEINSSDVVRVRLDRLSATHAHVQYTKYMTPTTNLTIDLNLEIGPSGTQTHLNGTISVTDSLFAHIPYQSHPSPAPENNHATPTDDTPIPEICGDSAWWVISDAYDPSLRPFQMTATSPKRGSFAGFTSIVMGGRRVSIDEAFKLSRGHAIPVRIWHMVRDLGEGDVALCKVGVVAETVGEEEVYRFMVHAPHPWGWESWWVV